MAGTLVAWYAIDRSDGQDADQKQPGHTGRLTRRRTSQVLAFT
jgi:hypothetical protein